jgi:methylated-DNA-[protein]-cysteine S-methyltransferase
MMHDELTTFRTSLGWCAMLGRGEQLRALTFGYRHAQAAVNGMNQELIVDARFCDWNRPLAKRIAAMLDGALEEFDDVQVDLDHLTPFSRRVVVACRKIPWGETRSYASVAAAAGRSGAARAVGRVMSQNRTPLVVPCHRVIGSAGKLVGFSAPQGIKLKRRLLALESALVCTA